MDVPVYEPYDSSWRRVQRRGEVAWERTPLLALPARELASLLEEEAAP